MIETIELGLAVAHFLDWIFCIFSLHFPGCKVGEKFTIIIQVF